MPGINLNFEENHIGKHYLCTLCKLLLRAPVQTVCGHRCCQSCVKEKRGSSDSFVCPEDGTLVTEVYPDRFVEREVSNLNVKCINKKLGCEWTGFVKQYEDHLANCPYEDVSCSNEGCSAVMKRNDLKKHLESECKFKQVNCKVCGMLVPQGVLKKHQQTECAASKTKCNQCGKDVIRAQLQNHQETDCDEAVAVCPFTKIGCAAKRPMKKNDRRKHMDNASLNHITYLLNYNIELEKQIAELQQDVRDKEEVSLEKSEVDITAAASREGKIKVLGAAAADEGSKKGVQYINIEGRESPEYVNTKRLVESDSSPFVAELGAKNQANLKSSFEEELSDLNSRIEAFGVALQDCQDEQRLIRDMVKNIDENNRRVDALRDLIRKLESRVVSLETSQQMKDVHISEQNERLGFLEDASYNGVLIWQINNFMKQRHDSITGKSVSIYSPFFYTGRYGYKMRLRVYLNGDGIGKGSHISLFFVICKGRYDSLLQWPFKQKVTMTILDQEHVKDVSDSFRPDPSSSSFQKPKNPMNIASGCPLFMPISFLDTHAYIRDDTLYIKAEVDVTGLQY